MDLLAACTAFTSVSDASSFTVGAAELRIPQSVASRRIAALEERLGGRLIDRTGRRATLTPFGRTMLPRARRLVELGEALDRDAVRARTVPFRLAVPANWSPADVAKLAMECRREQVALDLTCANPAERNELVRLHDVEASLSSAPAEESTWVVPLGVGSAAAEGDGRLRIASLKGDRSGQPKPPRRIWIEPEDDIPALRDTLIRFRDAVGLAPVQVSVAPTLIFALTEVLSAGDLLLCSERQAAELRLHWRPVADVVLARGYVLSGPRGSDIARVSQLLSRYIGAAIQSEGGQTDDVSDRI